MSAAVAAEFILLAALWGASFLFMRLGTLEFGPLPTAGLRVAIASLALLPVMLSRGLWPQLRQHWKPVMICGLINSAIPFALFSFALLSISTGLSSILNATVPLFGALVAWLWLGDKPGASRTVGLVIGFIGVALLASGKASFKPDASGAVTAWGILACLLATISYAVAASFTRRYLSGLNSLMVATGRPRAASWLKQVTSTKPLSTAMPMSAIKPTEAGTDRYSPDTASATTPPIRASGMLANTKMAWRRLPSVANSTPTISASATGTTSARRAAARCWFSNWPPQVRL